MINGGVILLDSTDTIVVAIELISAELIKVLQVTLGLLVLVHQLSKPSRGIMNLDHVEVGLGKLDDLAHRLGVLQPQHGNIRRPFSTGGHGIVVKEGDCSLQDYSVRLGSKSAPELKNQQIGSQSADRYQSGSFLLALTE